MPGMKDVRVMYARLDGEMSSSPILPSRARAVLVFSPVKQGDFHYDFFPTKDLLRYVQLLLE